MSMFRERVLGRLGARRTLVSLIVVAILVISSAVAAVAMSGKPAAATLAITSMSHDSEEGYVGQPVEWEVVVEVQDQGQQGKGLLFTWDWDDGNYTVHHLKPIGPNSTVVNAQTHAWSEPGHYKVIVSVWDGFEPEQNPLRNVSARTWFVVGPASINTPPEAAFDVEPEEGTVTTIFHFDASSSSDLEDPTESLQVRWDWEFDENWDTNYSTQKTIEHVFCNPGVYTVAMEVRDTGGLTNMSYRSVTVLREVFLEERFESWESLDEGWTIWNRTFGSFENWFDIDNGTLVASNNGVLILSNYDSYANWSGEVTYDDLLTISMRIFLPLDCDAKIGWAGQVFIMSIEDVSGEVGLIMRWVMDNPGDTYPVGWTYWSAQTGHAEQICPFLSGWHTVGLVLNKQTNSWTAFFDGLAYPGLSFSKQTANGFDIGSVKLVNVLREEVQIVMVDDLVIAEGAPNEAPVANFDVSVEGLMVSVDASASWDLEDPATELEVRWDWQNDGVWDTNWTTEKLSSHAYSVGGTYTVILEVRDSGGLSDTANRSVTVGEPSQTEHEPIWINGNDDFTYENGVVQGDGSAQNPYVIEGWSIEADSTSGITILNTDAHFVLRDVEVYDGLDSGTGSGIWLGSVANGYIDMCAVSNCLWGIGVFSCSDIWMFDSELANCYYGIGIVDSSQIDVYYNRISDSIGIGIAVNFTFSFRISNNTIAESGFIGVEAGACQDGWIASNIVSNSNYCGIRLIDHNEQIIFCRNALLNNTIQAEDDNLAENSWSHIYPIGGNYWSDYIGVDLYSGPDQDIPGSDGIGDTPYTIGVFDQYPHMVPYPG